MNVYDIIIVVGVIFRSCGAMAGWCRELTLLLLVACLVSQSAASTRPSDVDALQALLRAWQESPKLLEVWSLHEGADPCGSRWRGVECCSSMHSVVGIDLSYAGLVGSIPVEIGDLDKLRYLDLSGNKKLTGTIPKEIGKLRKLTTLILSDCDLTGTPPIQELDSLEKLKFLSLHGNPSLDVSDFHESSSEVVSRFIGNGLKFFGRRALLQVAPPTPVTNPATPPNTATSPFLPPAPAPGPRAPAPAPILPPAPPTPVRTYLMWVGIGAFCLVLSTVATSCLCRKFGENKIRGAQRLPPLPRYH